MKVLDEALDQVVGLAALIAFALVFGLVGGLVYGCYQIYKSRHDPPKDGPWSEPAGVGFAFDGGLRMGEEINWH